MTEIILASSSPYRRALLAATGLPFRHCRPNIEEHVLPGESAETLVKRLATEKAQALQNQFTDAWIIGSDQVLSLNGQILGKPGTYEKAFAQLTQCAGQRARLYTGLAIIHPGKHLLHNDIDYYDITYRNFQKHQIESYLKSEKPYDCCGSLKAEGSGIRLLKSLSGHDPNTLIGLPIIKIIDFLSQHDTDLLNKY